MAGKLLTKQRAADVLGVSGRSVYRYMQRGRLRSVHEGDTIGIPEEDVYRLKQVLVGPTPSKGDLGMILSRVLTLENHMATVMRILNVRYDPLNLTLPEFKTLYQMAETLAADGWSPHMEEQWADTFVRLKPEDLERLEEATDDPHPWRTVLRLATSMHINCYREELRGQLAAGRQNVLSVAGIWCITKGESPKAFDMLVERDATPNKRLMRQITKAKRQG